MDLNLVKQKLEALNSKSTSTKREKVDYSKIIWKPKAGKHIIRIVPSLINKNNPFREIFLHYGFAKFPIFALTNWGEKDPIVEFAAELRKTSERENWVLAKKIEPKMRVFIPVVVRGEEHMGTRLWEVGKLIYTQFLTLTDDEDYGGDYTDVMAGRDFTVTATDDVVAGNKAIKCTISPKPKTTPITDDKDLLERILNEQPDILAINRKYTFDALKDILEKWLDPENATDSSVETPDESKNDLPWGKEEEVKSSKSGGKKSKTDKFDELFKDEK